MLAEGKKIKRCPVYKQAVSYLAPSLQKTLFKIYKLIV